LALCALCALLDAACGSSSPSNPTATAAPPSGAPSTQPGSPTPDACTLLTVADATTLNGSPQIKQPGAGGIDCTYAGAGGPAESGVEIAVKVESDAATAHADFPSWVQPVPGALPPGFTITPESGVGDEASETHSGTFLDGIFFRHGAVLIKIGCNPPASDAALQAAANTVIGRL
jgi:hypothetical protein